MSSSKAESRGLSLLSGGLDSQLAVKVLQSAGAEMEGVVFETPFFSSAAARKAAAALGIRLHVVDFTDDIVGLLEHPPHGFGSAMNPCIDCHAAMIRSAGRLMVQEGFDFVSTGEVLGQRPMSQNRQALGVVEKTSGMAGRLVRPLSAKLLDPTVPEMEGILDREKLLDISGRRRERQIALARSFGLEDYPSPAGGCKLTEEGFAKRLRDLMEHEGLRDRRLVDLVTTARRFRLPGGASLMLGRDRSENEILLKNAALGALLEPVGVSGPTALVPAPYSREDIAAAAGIVVSYSKDGGGGVATRVDVVESDGAKESLLAAPMPREKSKEMQIC